MGYTNLVQKLKPKQSYAQVQDWREVGGIECQT